MRSIIISGMMKAKKWYQKKYPPHEEGLSGYDFFLKMGFSVEH
jgi:hypothetical protein